ncbi:MAG: indolepyruvate ferredoxin oxidoreductase, partial [Tardiphaga sp.]|nr:indolepyruvate ferredoxin oxidoreductase [Tardiphaga sp.]
ISYAKLLAYKDEYEVARLYTDGRFEKQLREQFEGDFKFNFNLAPPMLPGTDAMGRPRKRQFGPWMLPAFRVLAKLRALRGTPFDMFGHSADRKLERDLIAGYEKDVATVLSLLSVETHDIALELLALPDSIRGFGPVKEASVEKAKARYAQLALDLVNPPPAPRQLAAE